MALTRTSSRDSSIHTAAQACYDYRKPVMMSSGWMETDGSTRESLPCGIEPEDWEANMLNWIASEWLTILVSLLVGAALAVFSHWLTATYQKRHDRRVGAFRKSDLHVKVLLSDLLPEQGFDEILFALGSSVKNTRDRAFCIVTFLISNEGDLSAKDVRLRVAWPAALMESVKRLDLERYQKGKSTVSGYEREAYTDDGYEHIVYRFSSIDPGSTAQLLEHVEVASVSEGPLCNSGETAHGSPHSTGTEPSRQMAPIHVFLQATDQTKQHASFAIRSVRQQSVDEICAYMHQATEKTIDIMNSKHTPPRIVKMIIVEPKLVPVPKPEGMDKILAWSAFWQQKEGSSGWRVDRIELASANDEFQS